MNTCDKAQVCTTPATATTRHPAARRAEHHLRRRQREGHPDDVDGGGGGAIYAQGGRLKVVNARFFNNVCDDLGPDVGGGAIRKLDSSRTALPVVRRCQQHVRRQRRLGNSCANGGALSSIGVSWNIINTLFCTTTRSATAPTKPGRRAAATAAPSTTTATTYHAVAVRRDIENNKANEGGSAIFFVSNDKTGSITIKDSTHRQPARHLRDPGFPGFFVIAKADPTVTNSTLQK